MGGGGRQVGGKGKARFGLTGKSASGNCLLWGIKCGEVEAGGYGLVVVCGGLCFFYGWCLSFLLIRSKDKSRGISISRIRTFKHLFAEFERNLSGI